MNRIGALPKDIKQKNDEEILRSLVNFGTFTVQDIANRTKISRLTITRALERFMEKGIVVASGKRDSTDVGGKKPQEYSLRSDRYMISIVPSGGKTACTVMNLKGEEIACLDSIFPLSIEYEVYINDIAGKIKELIGMTGMSIDQLCGIVFCSGGVFDKKTGVIRATSVPYWEKHLHVVRDLKRSLGFEVSVEIENVSKVSSSNIRFNPVSQGKRVAVMYADYGVAISLLEDGKIPETSNDVIGELGHMCLEPSDEEVCVCGSRGCFEMLISEKRINRRIAAMPEKERDELLKNYDGKQDIRAYILEEDKRGNEASKELCSYLANYIGLAFRNVCLAFDPHFFIVQGVFAKASDRFFETVIGVIKENKYLEDINIVISRENEPLSELAKKGSLNLILSKLI